jgi:hypothetical protein
MDLIGDACLLGVEYGPADSDDAGYGPDDEYGPGDEDDDSRQCPDV